jgi:hypothetical protein
MCSYHASFGVPFWNTFWSLFFKDVSHIDANDESGKHIRKNITPHRIYAGAYDPPVFSPVTKL